MKKSLTTTAKRRQRKEQTHKLLKINFYDEYIPLFLRCISHWRSATKDPRTVPLTFVLRPWQSQGIHRIDPTSSLASHKSRKRSTCRVASRRATWRFANFQSSLATTWWTRNILSLLFHSTTSTNKCACAQLCKARQCDRPTVEKVLEYVRRNEEARFFQPCGCFFLTSRKEKKRTGPLTFDHWCIFGLFLCVCVWS